jgi:hypothetical protein
VPNSEERFSFRALYAALVRNDEARNTITLNDVLRAIEEGRSPLLLTERREKHLRGYARSEAPLSYGEPNEACDDASRTRWIPGN